MKILVASDLHTEFMVDKGLTLAQYYGEQYEHGAYDVLVLAGDVGTASTLGSFLKVLLDTGIPIVYVLGNHEYYGTSRSAVLTTLYKINALHENFHWLSIYNEVAIEVLGKRFVGDTLWFPSHPDEFQYRGSLSDFHVIEEFATWVYDHNEKAQKALRDNIQEGDIVVTHHAPSQKSIAFEYRNAPTIIFYVTDMEDTIETLRPALWIHGHMHLSFDYMHSQTRVMCNPFGYERFETNTEFKLGNFIEV